MDGDPKVVRNILAHVSDTQLLQVCSIDKNTWNEVCDDEFLRNRLETKYPGISQYKQPEQSWRKYFLQVTYYVAKMKEQYNFTYRSGDFKRLYEAMREYEPVVRRYARTLPLYNYNDFPAQTVYDYAVRDRRSDIANYLKDIYNL